ncbi:hypothetical protein V8G54_017141 [Vigna mungo]|uniref:Uncharacterized protein n=1 Tax=Vigna mungo TaxID=3915 RepID=A0AAQ3NMF8_VIGMU
MAQECSNGTVVQDNQLWSPPPDNHPLLCIPFFKPLGHPLLLLFLTLLLPLLLRHHPYEPMTRRFNPACNLVKLFIREMTNAPKAYVHHRVFRLRVKPTHALMHTHHALHAPLCFLFRGSGYERGRPQMPSLVPRRFLVVADVFFSVELREVVYD